MFKISTLMQHISHEIPQRYSSRYWYSLGQRIKWVPHIRSLSSTINSCFVNIAAIYFLSCPPITRCYATRGKFVFSGWDPTNVCMYIHFPLSRGCQRQMRSVYASRRRNGAWKVRRCLQQAVLRLANLDEGVLRGRNDLVNLAWNAIHSRFSNYVSRPRSVDVGPLYLVKMQSLRCAACKSLTCGGINADNASLNLLFRTR